MLFRDTSFVVADIVRRSNSLDDLSKRCYQDEEQESASGLKLLQDDVVVPRLQFQNHVKNIVQGERNRDRVRREERKQPNNELMHLKGQLQAHVMTTRNLKSENGELQRALTQGQLTAEEKSLETENLRKALTAFRESVLSPEKIPLVDSNQFANSERSSEEKHE